jgi:Ribbon-helix-helix protein, copG family
MSILTLRVPDNRDKALKRQSAALGTSKSDLVRKALRHDLRVAEFPSLRTKLIARAQAARHNPMRKFSKLLTRSEDRA